MGLRLLNTLKKQKHQGDGSILALLDIRMPVMNGFEFLEEVNSVGGPLKDSLSVIMLTSSDNPLDLEKARSYKAKGYINKPLNEESLRPFLIIND